MSAREPTTEAESVALRKFGWGLEVGGSAGGAAAAILDAYRAGFSAGRQQPQQSQLQVFRSGDPEPGPEVGAVLDSEGDVWARKGDARKGDDSWGIGGDAWTWVLQYGPLVGLPPLPDWLAAVKADSRHGGS